VFRINHAILHVFDFTSCVNVFSQAELDLSAKSTKSFVASHARKAQGNIANRHGRFAPDSAFAGEIEAYFAGKRDFVSLSTDIAHFLADELGKADKLESSDLLVVDFEGDTSGRVGDVVASDIEAAAAADVASEAEEAAYEGRGTRYLALLLLASRQAFMHEVDDDGRSVHNEIARHYAILPGPAQKVASYALVEEGSLDVWFCDKERTIAGQRTMLIPEGLLQCSQEPSVREVIDTVTSVVADVAEQYGDSPTAGAVALSKAKAAIAETATDDDMISTKVVAEEAFADSDVMREKFEEAMGKAQVPEKVRAEPKATERAVRNHRIKTDTGIVVTFPSEYCDNPDYIEFTSEPDGLISISLRNIGKIENG
jgi:hypothetical protein